ncbi:MAG: GNAT family N-acetyltransferase [Candidatus Hodarchaeota archaeon]
MTLTRQDLLDFILRENPSKFCFLIYDLLADPDNCEFFGKFDEKKNFCVFVFKYLNNYVFYGSDALLLLPQLTREKGEVAIVFDPSNQQPVEENFHQFRRGEDAGSGNFNTYVTMTCVKTDFLKYKENYSNSIKKIKRHDITSNIPPPVSGILDSNEIIAYGAVIDNQLVSIAPIPHLYLGEQIPRFGIIRGVWTDPHFRGKGLATHSMEKLCSVLFNEFYLEKIYLWVEKHNDPAQKVYKKIGFRCESSWRGSRCYFR